MRSINQQHCHLLGGLLEMRSLRSYPNYNWFRICILTSSPAQKSDLGIASTFNLITVDLLALIYWDCTESVVALNLSSVWTGDLVMPTSWSWLHKHCRQDSRANVRQRVEIRENHVEEPGNCFSAGYIGVVGSRALENWVFEMYWSMLWESKYLTHSDILYQPV